MAAIDIVPVCGVPPVADCSEVIVSASSEVADKIISSLLLDIDKFTAF